MTTAGTWYPPAAGTGGFLSTLVNPPFAPMSTTPPLWRQMQISALAAPPSPDGPAHRFASMLNVVAGYLNNHGHQDAAFLLLDEADLANKS